MVEPGPTSDELDRILEAGLRVPDHGKLFPWRYVVIADEARAVLGEKLEAVFRLQNPDAREQQCVIERTRFLRAPLVVAVISSVDPVHPKIPEWEQVLSAGAVCMNMLNAAHALGYASQWLTEWYAYDEAFLAELGLGENERLAGYMFFGSAAEKPDERPRATVEQVRSDWQPA